MCTLYTYKEYDHRILLKGRMTGQQHVNRACIMSSLRREDLWQFLPLPLAIEKLLSDHFIFVFAEGACSAAAGKDASRITLYFVSR